MLHVVLHCPRRKYTLVLFVITYSIEWKSWSCQLAWLNKVVVSDLISWPNLCHSVIFGSQHNATITIGSFLRNSGPRCWHTCQQLWIQTSISKVLRQQRKSWKESLPFCSNHKPCRPLRAFIQKKTVFSNLQHLKNKRKWELA